MTFDRILLAHDLSQASDRALRLAANMAARHEAALTILHIYSIAPLPPASQEAVQRALAGLGQTASSMGVRTLRIEAKAGSPADAIVEVANGGGYDLLVMGMRARKWLRRMRVGSVAEGVQRRTRCPVLTVHADSGETRVASRALDPSSESQRSPPLRPGGFP